MFYKNKIVKLIIVIFLLITTLATGKGFYVDRAHSSVKFKIKCLAVGKVTGKFSHFSGSYDLEGDSLKSFNAVCYTDSINTGNNKRDKNLKSVHLFNSSQFPKMTMEMLKFKNNKMLINLTIKGITKPVIFDYKPKRSSKTQENKNRTGFRILGKIHLKDFNLNMKKAVGPKGVVLGKTVKIIADIEGERKNILEEGIESIFDSAKQIFAPK